LRSLFVGFETFSPQNLKAKQQKAKPRKRLCKSGKPPAFSLGIMINGSFVFGLDDDDKDTFKRTVDWGVKHSHYINLSCVNPIPWYRVV
jgi:hypothetical protein